MLDVTALNVWSDACSRTHPSLQLAVWWTSLLMELSCATRLRPKFSKKTMEFLESEGMLQPRPSDIPTSTAHAMRGPAWSDRYGPRPAGAINHYIADMLFNAWSIGLRSSNVTMKTIVCHVLVSLLREAISDVVSISDLLEEAPASKLPSSVKREIEKQYEMRRNRLQSYLSKLPLARLSLHTEIRVDLERRSVPVSSVYLQVRSPMPLASAWIHKLLSCFNAGYVRLSCRIFRPLLTCIQCCEKPQPSLRASMTRTHWLWPWPLLCTERQRSINQWNACPTTQVCKWRMMSHCG